MTPGTCGRATGALEPLPDRGVGIKISPVNDGPNGGLYYAESLQTGVRPRMQVLRDYRTDAVPHAVLAGDSVSGGFISRVNIDHGVTVGVADSSCMQETGFRHKVDSLWQHEHCHQLRNVAIVRSSSGLAKVVSVESLVRSTYEAVADKQYVLMALLALQANN